MFINNLKLFIIFLKLFGEKIFVNSVKVFPASIKSINPIQKYPHIIKSNAYILKIFVFMDKERLINVLFYLEYVLLQN